MMKKYILLLFLFIPMLARALVPGAVISDTNGNVAGSTTVSATQIGYLATLTGPIASGATKNAGSTANSVLQLDPSGNVPILTIVDLNLSNITAYSYSNGDSLQLTPNPGTDTKAHPGGVTGTGAITTTAKVVTNSAVATVNGSGVKNSATGVMTDFAGINFPIRGVIPGANGFGRGWAVWLRSTISSAAVNHVFGFLTWAPNGAQNAAESNDVEIYQNTVGLVAQTIGTVGLANYSAVPTNASDVLRLEINGGGVTVSVGTYSGGWPAVDSMVVLVSDYVKGTVITTAYTGAAAADATINLTFQENVFSTGGNQIISNIRIDQL